MNYEINGITNVIRNIFRNSDSKINYHIVVKNIVDEHLMSELRENNIIVHTLPSRIRKPLHYISELRKIIASTSFDIIHAHGNSGTLAIETYLAKKNGIPIRIAHSHNSACKHKLIHFLLKPLMLRSTTLNVACSKKAGKWLFNENFIVLNNGIDLEKFIYNEETRNMYRKDLNIIDKKVYGHVGHFSYQKNHDFLIDVFKKIYTLDNNSILLLVGDGVLRKKVEEKVNSLGLNDAVLFIGSTPNAPQLLQVMDLLIFPSLFEGLPLTLVEAQAAGLPCIVSDKVTPESKLTELVEFISLDSSSSIWAEKILAIKKTNRESQSTIAATKIAKSGYNIKENVIVLEHLYFQNYNIQ